MGLGFLSTEEEIDDEYIPLYRTIIECPKCKDDVVELQEGSCSCGNIEISQLKSISDVRHIAKSTWTHFKAVGYLEEPPNIYEVLLIEECP